MAARLKVFVTSDGLTDYVVAVSSRAKALAAWGLRQDVFKEGQARETRDPALVKSALAKPGEVLRKPAGAAVPAARLRPAEPVAPKGPTKAQLKRVADAEAALAALTSAQTHALADVEAQRAALDQRLADLASRHGAERRRLEDRLKAARQALG